MSIEGGDNLDLGLGSSRKNGIELDTTLLADSAEAWGSFHDTEFATRHEPGLPLEAVMAFAPRRRLC